MVWKNIDCYKPAEQLVVSGSAHDPLWKQTLLAAIVVELFEKQGWIATSPGSV